MKKQLNQILLGLTMFSLVGVSLAQNKVVVVPLIGDDVEVDTSAQAAFYTISEYSGDLGGIQGADDICQQEANENSSVVPPGIYKALLGTQLDSAGQSLSVAARTNQVPSRGDFRLGNDPLTNIFGDELIPHAWLILSQVILPVGFETITDSEGYTVVTSQVFPDDLEESFDMPLAWAGYEPGGQTDVRCGDWVSDAADFDGHFLSYSRTVINGFNFGGLLNSRFTQSCDQALRLICVEQ